MPKRHAFPMLPLPTSTWMAGNPAFAWLTLSMQTAEMMVAAAEVITHRTTRMALAGTSPSARDRTEFLRMGTEKVEAAIESGAAALRHDGMAHVARAQQLWQQLATDVMTSTCNAGQGATPMTMALPWWRAMVAASTAQAHAAASVVELTTAAVAPYHRRARANATRLRRVRVGSSTGRR